MSVPGASGGDFTPTGGQGLSEGLSEMRQAVTNVAPVLERIGQEVVLPAYGRNYASSGLRKRTGLLVTALTKRGARGSIFEVRGNELTTGVDVQAIPYAKWAIGGRGPVVAKRAKALRFYDRSGKVIFRKRVGPAPARPVVFLLPSDLVRANLIVAEMIGEGWRVSASGAGAG